MRMSDWSSDVCSSDLDDRLAPRRFENLAVDDDVRAFALDADFVALLEMDPRKVILSQRAAPGRAEHAEQRADAAVDREQLHMTAGPMLVAGADAEQQLFERGDAQQLEFALEFALADQRHRNRLRLGRRPAAAEAKKDGEQG